MHIFIKESFCETKSGWIRKSLPGSGLQFFPLHQCKRSCCFEQKSHGNNDLSEDLHHLHNVFSLSLCFISERHNLYPWFDTRELRHSTEEMKAVAEENCELPISRVEMVRDWCFRQAVSVSSCEPAGEDCPRESAAVSSSSTLCADRGFYSAQLLPDPRNHQVPSWGSLVSRAGLQFFCSRAVLWWELLKGEKWGDERSILQEGFGYSWFSAEKGKLQEEKIREKIFERGG